MIFHSIEENHVERRIARTEEHTNTQFDEESIRDEEGSTKDECQRKEKEGGLRNAADGGRRRAAWGTPARHAHSLGRPQWTPFRTLALHWHTLVLVG